MNCREMGFRNNAQMQRWMAERQAEIKAMSNADLLDEALFLAQGDDYDGGFSKRGQWEYDHVVEELKLRLSEWLKGAKSRGIKYEASQATQAKCAG